MELYPAIDIRDGTAVRLAQGDFDHQRDYGDPVELAQRFADAGARWLHVVDLDAARSGRPVNRATVLEVAGAVGVPVESGGGVRTEADVAELVAGGISRIVLGTAAVEDPGLARRCAASFPGRVAIGLDYRLDAEGRAEVAVRGWEEVSGRTVTDLLSELADVGLAAVIVTAIERDGMLTGPDLEGLRRILQATALPVIASGGVAEVGDVEALAELVVDVGSLRPHGGEVHGRDTPPDGSSARWSDLAADGGTATETDAEPEIEVEGKADVETEGNAEVKVERSARRSVGGRRRRLSGVITGRALVEGRMTVEEGLAACARSG